MSHRRVLFHTFRCSCALLLSARMALAAPPPPKIVGPGGVLPKVGGNYDIPASLGVQKGGNLFQTFIQFDLTASETATFGGAPGLTNIFSRVTGGRSFIDGTIRSSSPGVNLYFLNANGITFGQHARLDVAGSFAATTADVLKFSDGGRFDAIDPGGDSLTAGNLSAYGFLGQRTSSITASYTQAPGLDLAVSQGKTLSLVAGSLDFDGGDVAANAVTFRAPGGRVEMAAVRKGDLNVNLAPGPKLGTARYSNVKINSEGAGSRGLAIRAGALDMVQTEAYSTGPVDVRVGGTATLDTGTKVLSRTDGAASAGNFSIRAGKIVLKSGSTIGSRALANATATAKAGKVSVVTNSLTIRNGSQVESKTEGNGAANNVSVRAGQVVISGDGSAEATGISSRSIRETGVVGDVGRSGDVSVQAERLQIVDGGSINGDTFGAGRGGNVSVSAREIAIDAQGNADVKTGIFSDSNLAAADGKGGDGGDVHVTAQQLSIRSGGLISTKTVGTGHGGDTVVKVTDLLIARGATPSFTGIAADSATNAAPGTPAGVAGPGGNVLVEADVARILDGGQISATTETQGKGGKVTVIARDLLVDGRNGTPSSISSDSISLAGAGGDSGGVDVTADRLLVSNGARISATTFGNGDAGEVHVRANTAYLTGAADDAITGILAASNSRTLPGRGGAITAEFGSLVLQGSGTIAGSTFGPGAGGDVVVTADSARLLGGGQIAADTSGLGRGGRVAVSAGELLVSGLGSDRRTGIFSGSSAIGPGGPAGSVRIQAGQAELVDGGSIAATSSSSGEGGSIVLLADELSLKRAGSVEASATGRGKAGSVEISVEQPLEIRELSSVRTTSAVSDAGTVSITSANDITIDEGSSVTVQASQGNAGRIALFATHRFLLRQSQLLAEAGMNGGDIFVDPTYVVLDRAVISANAVMIGGNILLVADNFLPSSTPITATGSTAGTVQITAPQLDLSGALATLTTQLVDASLRFQERCAMRLGGDASTFLVLGRGGVEDSPSDPAVIVSRPKPISSATADESSRRPWFRKK